MTTKNSSDYGRVANIGETANVRCIKCPAVWEIVINEVIRTGWPRHCNEFMRLVREGPAEDEMPDPVERLQRFREWLRTSDTHIVEIRAIDEDHLKVIYLNGVDLDYAIIDSPVPPL